VAYKKVITTYIFFTDNPTRFYEMGRTCGAYGGREKGAEVVVGET
jgi:hypothetical protein